MGVASTFGSAFLKAQDGAGTRLPRTGTVFISVNENDKANTIPIARRLKELGFEIIATRGTREALHRIGIEARFVYKVNEGRPNVVDLIKSKEIDLIVNTPLGRDSFYDERAIRRAAVQYRVPCITTLTGARAAVDAIESLQKERLEIGTLQEYHADLEASKIG